MADEGNADTFEHTLSGRTMTFLKTSGGQLTMMRRYVQLLQTQMAAAEKEGDGTTVAKLLAKMHDIAWTAVESRFISDDDLEFVRMEVISGKLDESQLFAILSNGAGADEPDDDAAVAAPKRKTPRKAAPRKAAPRKAARTANPRRASR